MQCQICGDTQGPFEIIDYKKRCVLACEACAKENQDIKTIMRISRYERKRKRKNEAANIRN